MLGAGRSSADLIRYLFDHALKENWHVRIGDLQNVIDGIQITDHAIGSVFEFDIERILEFKQEFDKSDLVISMLPARYHLSVARQCLESAVHMVTASYVSKEMAELNEACKSQNLIFLNEVGVDPGIDHMSAMRVINRIKNDGGNVTEFETFTGGLVAPEYDNNPWNYKFTWNPRNVVLAGQGGAVKFIEKGRFKYIPYHKIFRRTEIIEIESFGKFEGYANRDSLKYREMYGLEDVQTMFRGTLRRPGFCRAWDVFVQLGMTDDEYVIEDSENMTYRQFLNSFLKYNPDDSVELKLMQYLKLDQDDVELMDKLKWLDLFSDEKIGLAEATPAQILQHILQRKWTLLPSEKDMIVMWHKFVYEMKGRTNTLESSMVVLGESQKYTAMSKTVGLPVAIAAKCILNGVISEKGVQVPVIESIYNPVLEELSAFNIQFNETITG